MSVYCHGVHECNQQRSDQNQPWFWRQIRQWDWGWNKGWNFAWGFWWGGKSNRCIKWDDCWPEELLHMYTFSGSTPPPMDRLTALTLGTPPITPSQIKPNTQLVKDMFWHAYDGYMYHALLASDLSPITCTVELPLILLHFQCQWGNRTGALSKGADRYVQPSQIVQKLWLSIFPHWLLFAEFLLYLTLFKFLRCSHFRLF